MILLDRVLAMGLFLACMLGMMWGCIQTIWGNLAEKNWNAVQKSAFNRWFYSGWSKERYIKQQRLTCWMMLPCLALALALLVGLFATQPEGFSLKQMFEKKPTLPLR